MSDSSKTQSITNNKTNNISPELIKRNEAIVAERSLRNFTALSSIISDSTPKKQSKLKEDPVSLSAKQDKEKILQEGLKKIEVNESGWWLSYRDSDNRLKSEEKTAQNRRIIISICGVPSAPKYYNAIGKHLNPYKYRFINIFLPGFDGEDERRGSYSGTTDQTLSLIDQFMDKLSIEKSSFLMHSYGGVVGKYFASCYPHRVESLIQIACAPLTKWIGWRQFEQMNHKNFKLIETLTLGDFNREEVRKQIQAQQNDLNEMIKTLSPEQQRKFSIILLSSKYDQISFLKSEKSIPGGMNEIFRRLRNSIGQFPRMIAYASKDQLFEAPIIEEEVMHFVLGPNSIQHAVSPSFAPELNLDRSNFSSNFVFKFDTASHMLHSEKGKELAQLITFFLQGLDHISPQHSMQSKL